MIKNTKDALAVINWCLDTESEDFWRWITDTTEVRGALDVPKFLRRSSGPVEPSHVFLHALNAAGVKKAFEDSFSRYVADSIVDLESTQLVCEYYLSEEEGRDFDDNCEERGLDPKEEYQTSQHVYAQAGRALGFDYDD